MTNRVTVNQSRYLVTVAPAGSVTVTTSSTGDTVTVGESTSEVVEVTSPSRFTVSVSAGSTVTVSELPAEVIEVGPQGPQGPAGADGGGAAYEANNLVYDGELTNPSANIESEFPGWGSSLDPDSIYPNSISTDVAGAFIYQANYVPVDKEQAFTVSADVFADPTEYSRIGFGLYDIDYIGLHRPLNDGASLCRTDLTTLAADLNPGDTVLHLTDSTGWETVDPYYMGFAWGPYTNSRGHTWPLVYGEFSFVGTQYLSHPDHAQDPYVSISGNDVTLASAWTGPVITAGTSITNSAYGLLSSDPLYATQFFHTTQTEAGTGDWQRITTTSGAGSLYKSAAWVRFHAVLNTEGLSLTSKITNMQLRRAVISGDLEADFLLTQYQLPAATDSARGGVLLATDAEAVDGTGTSDAVTPAGLTARLTTAVAEPATPAAGFGILYIDVADDKLKFKGSAGTVTTLANP